MRETLTKVFLSIFFFMHSPDGFRRCQRFFSKELLFRFLRHFLWQIYDVNCGIRFDGRCYDRMSVRYPNPAVLMTYSLQLESKPTLLSVLADTCFSLASAMLKKFLKYSDFQLNIYSINDKWLRLVTRSPDWTLGLMYVIQCHHIWPFYI